MKKLIGILLLFVSMAAFSQDKPLVQFTGVIYNADSINVVIPYVTITNAGNHNAATTANYKGYFSFVVHEQDTLHFTAIGYAPEMVVIPANVKNKSYTIQVTLKPQITNLPMVRVFPWATTDEFRRDFIAAKLADDDLEIARKNISRASIVAMSNTLARDGLEQQAANAAQMHTNLVNSHSITNPLLNPLAWGSLIKSISDGSKN